MRWSEGDEPDPNAPPSDRQLADRLVEIGPAERLAGQAVARRPHQVQPRALSDHRLDRPGGHGAGFQGRARRRSGRIVAVKVLPRDKSTPEAIANFTREIQALASLNHPKLVRAVDAGNDGNVNYLVTEYVPGSDLRKLVRRSGPLSMEAAATSFRRWPKGSSMPTRKGIVHRDVKPGNVLVTPEGDAKLSDLGLAGPMDRPTPTRTPATARSWARPITSRPTISSRPWNPTPAWDIYSLGCTLYYAVTGKVPFPGGTTADKARAHCELRPLDPRRLNPS